jgi:hypothetical protein
MDEKVWSEIDAEARIVRISAEDLVRAAASRSLPRMAAAIQSLHGAAFTLWRLYGEASARLEAP